jgi:hypothetical protein
MININFITKPLITHKGNTIIIVFIEGLIERVYRIIIKKRYFQTRSLHNFLFNIYIHLYGLSNRIFNNRDISLSLHFDPILQYSTKQD